MMLCHTLEKTYLITLLTQIEHPVIISPVNALFEIYCDVYYYSLDLKNFVNI